MSNEEAHYAALAVVSECAHLDVKLWTTVGELYRHVPETQRTLLRDRMRAVELQAVRWAAQEPRWLP
jgi:hypothetical protein